MFLHSFVIQRSEALSLCTRNDTVLYDDGVFRCAVSFYWDLTHFPHFRLYNVTHSCTPAIAVRMVCVLLTNFDNLHDIYFDVCCGGCCCNACLSGVFCVFFSFSLAPHSIAFSLLCLFVSLFLSSLFVYPLALTSSFAPDLLRTLTPSFSPSHSRTSLDFSLSLSLFRCLFFLTK